MPLPRPLRRRATSGGTWTGAVDRYRRAVERYYATLRLMPDRALRRELTQLGETLDAVLEDFEDALDHRSSVDPEDQAAAVNHIHRAATLCAHATEAAIMANEAAWRYDDQDVSRCVDSVRAFVKKIDEIGDQMTPHS